MQKSLNAKIDGKKVSDGPFLAEDLFFSAFGFGSGIFEPVDLNFIDRFSLEPVPFELAVSDNPLRPFLFHRVDA